MNGKAKRGEFIRRQAGRCPEGTSHDPLALSNAKTLQLQQELGAARDDWTVGGGATDVI